MRKHSIDIDEWLWKRYQRLSGLTNPATYMRAVLGEHVADTETMVHIEDAAVQDQTDPPTAAPIAPPPTWKRFVRDRGRPWVAQRWTTCDWMRGTSEECGLAILEGERCVYRRNDEGRIEMLHMRHFEDPASSSSSSEPDPGLF